MFRIFARAFPDQEAGEKIEDVCVGGEGDGRAGCSITPTRSLPFLERQ
jgi:hypothetical protein